MLFGYLFMCLYTGGEAVSIRFNMKNKNSMSISNSKSRSLSASILGFYIVVKNSTIISTKTAFFILLLWTFYFFYLGNLSLYIFLILTLVFAAFLSLTTASLIYALIFLMLTYINAAVIFFIINLDFLALCLLFIYVGAIAILFIFVIMTLSPDHGVSYDPFTFFDKLCLLLYSLLLIGAAFLFTYVELPTEAFYRWSTYNSSKECVHTITSMNDNITQIGLLLYGAHTFLFYLAILILFLGFFAPIVLTLDENDEDRLHPNARKLKKKTFKVYGWC